jgi:hypothetical protein
VKRLNRTLNERVEELEIQNDQLIDRIQDPQKITNLTKVHT